MAETRRSSIPRAYLRVRSRMWSLLAGAAIAAPGCSGDSVIDKDFPRPLITAFSDVSDLLPPSVRAAGQRSMEARAADVDGDGDLDLLVAVEGAPNVLLVNDGTGRFADRSEQIPQVALDSEDIAAGDFDRDGDVDFVVSSEDPVAGRRFTEYYLNNGRGTFSDASARVPYDGEANAIVAGDVDRDGDLDLVISGVGPEHLFLNDGAGTFVDSSAGRIPSTPPDATQDVALGDVDGDRDLDLLVANESGGNRLLLNDGTGRFVAAHEGAFPARATAEATRNGDFGDADGDGDLDVVFANIGLNGADPRARLLLNDGGGRFQDVSATHLGESARDLFDTDFVDLDRDGDLDLVAARFPAAPLTAFRNQGAGRFALADGLFPSWLRAQSVEAEAADFNGDGKVDVYFANFAESPDMLLLAH